MRHALWLIDHSRSLRTACNLFIKEEIAEQP
jgi:hypothetical protein